MCLQYFTSRFCVLHVVFLSVIFILCLFRDETIDYIAVKHINVERHTRGRTQNFYSGAKPTGRSKKV